VEVRDISEFTKGWFIGDFEPTMLKTSDFEVGVKFFVEGDTEPLHKQIIATEFTVVISGDIQMNGKKFTRGQIVRIDPEEPADFLALTDASLLCLKTPSIPSDRVVL
jgi:hypothetical protein